MEIDFKGKGMEMHFDKVPKLIYFNNEYHGCGTVLLDGKTIKALQTVDIHAVTDSNKPSLLSYNIGFYNLEKRETETIAIGKSTLETISIPIRIMDLIPFNVAMAHIREFLNDKRIPEEIRKEYADNFKSTITGRS
jgi:hypothetical protein